MHISGTTTLLGLIGTPVSHSKSPAMYNFFFREFGLDYAYLAFDVSEENCEDAVAAIRTLNLRGANVTMPCKHAVIPNLDRLTPAAQAVSAVNTIVNDHGVLTGHMTDGCGFTRSLLAGKVSVQGKKITLLGAGGAAAAIAVQCALEGASQLAVFNRRDPFWGARRGRPWRPSTRLCLAVPSPSTIWRTQRSLPMRSGTARFSPTPHGWVWLPTKISPNIQDLSLYRPDLIVTDTVYAPVETRMLREAKDLRCPVLLHVHTVKGQGYGPAEADPGRFHGIGPFDVRTGSGKPAAPSFSSVFGETLTRLAGEDRRICALTAAMVDGTGLTKFSKTYPSRFFDVGIAEGHAVATAAGMAKQGLVPVLAVYSSFLQRGYDMLLHDVALSGLHVVLGVDRAGLVGADGETHHGCFDVMYLSQVPGMKVFCPASFAELRTMLRRAVQEETGPVAVRYPRGGEGAYQEDRSDEAIACLRPGTDITLLTYGILINEALSAADLLAQRDISAQVLKLSTIAPLSPETIRTTLTGTKRLLVLEDCVETGCVGQRVAAMMAQLGMAPRRLVLKNQATALSHRAV